MWLFVRAEAAAEDSFLVGGHSDRSTVLAGIRQNPPGSREELGEVCSAIDSQVDWTILIEVFLTSAAQ
jgi:hypothetical protein